MGELLKNAGQGWLKYMAAGKVPALLILGVLLCVFLNMVDQRKKDAYAYSGIMTLLCICPLSAAILMLYQTRFYDYEWIWTTVPMTVIVACSEVLLVDYLSQKTEGRGEKTILFLAVLLVLNFLSGRLGSAEWKVEDIGKERRAVAAALSEIRDTSWEEIILWGPKEVMAQARSLDSDIKLLYGRNLWQEHLNAYTYDSYPEEIWELYIWMILAGRSGEIAAQVDRDLVDVQRGLDVGSMLDGADCVKTALELGANTILLPGNMSMEAVSEMGESFALSTRVLGEYYLLKKTE